MADHDQRNSQAYGFDAFNGLLWTGTPEVSDLPERLDANPRLASSVRVALRRAYDEALRLIEARSDALHAVTAELFNRKALEGAEVAEIVKKPGRNVVA